MSASFLNRGGKANSVSAKAPLPTEAMFSPAVSTPVSGSTAASIVSAAFTPALGRPIYITLSGTWTGTVTLKRSVDGGVTKLPVTIGGSAWAVYTTNACEAAWEEAGANVTLYLDITRTTGTIIYDMRQ